MVYCETVGNVKRSRKKNVTKHQACVRQEGINEGVSSGNTTEADKEETRTNEQPNKDMKTSKSENNGKIDATRKYGELYQNKVIEGN